MPEPTVPDLHSAARESEILSAEDFEHYRKAPGALYGTAIPPLSVRSHEALRAVLAAEATEPPPAYGIPLNAMLDLWMALGGEPDAFDRMLAEDRRTPADTWSQLLAIVRGITWEALAEGDTNPPLGPEIEALIERRASGLGGRRWRGYMQGS